MLDLIDRSLRAKLTTALVFVAALTSGASGFFAVRESVVAMRRQQQRESLALARTIAIQTDELLAKTRFAIEHLAADPVIGTLDPARVKPLLDAVAATAELIDGIVVADARGRIVAMDAVPPETRGLLSPAGRSFLSEPEARRGGFSKIYRSVSGRWCFAILEPVKRRGATVGEVAGIVALDLHTLAGLERVRFGETGRVFMIEKSGRIILHPRAARFLQNMRGVLPASIWREPSGVVVYQMPGGRRELAGFARITQTGWTVMASRTLAEAYAPSEDLALVLIGIFLVALVIATLLGAGLAAGISRPIRRLVHGARELASGRLDQRLETSSRDEIGELIESFNAMARSLSRTISQLNAFGYSVAHDLRAPARTVAAFSDLVLREQAGLDEPSRRSLVRVRDAGERMRRMLDGLLDLSRISQVKLAVERVDLSKLAREVFDEVAAAEPGRGVDAVVADGLLDLGDPRLLHVLLQNLLQNAWKFSRAAPRARVEFGRETRDGERVYFVRDNGAGFDPALAKRLFMPFHRLPNAEDVPGLGIGLATSLRIVEAHGGRIWAESAGAGRGAAVFFTLAAEA